MAVTCETSPTWGHAVEPTKKFAIAHFQLRALGWRGFDALDWVQALLHKYPSIPVILISTHTKPAGFVALEQLAETMSPEDRHHLRDYIIGKLGLEELSCQRSGPGAGSCDARTALHRCVEICLEWE